MFSLSRSSIKSANFSAWIFNWFSILWDIYIYTLICWRISLSSNNIEFHIFLMSIYYLLQCLLFLLIVVLLLSAWLRYQLIIWCVIKFWIFNRCSSSFTVSSVLFSAFCYFIILPSSFLSILTVSYKLISVWWTFFKSSFIWLNYLIKLFWIIHMSLFPFFL